MTYTVQALKRESEAADSRETRTVEPPNLSEEEQISFFVASQIKDCYM